ncbi:MAG TPA: PEP-CTERM sorting domain-containing protein [Candidatus Sulfotelmatobacter sp.]|nr:PEP-CTERM sorting domain-containing protein [Candidatus Sulfotelmatobacter sp.]
MKKATFALLLAIMLPALARADVVYSFTGAYSNSYTHEIVGPFSFTLTVPSPITADAFFDPGGQLVCDTCFNVWFAVDAVAHGLTKIPSNMIGYGVLEDGVPGRGFYFYFAPPSFTVDGTYTDVIGSWFPNQGTLTVTGAANSSTPEPGTLAMLAPALGFLGWLRKRVSI